MTDERQQSLAEQERRIRESIRSTGDVRADAAFRGRLKREFVGGTITESAERPEKSRGAGWPRWWWIPIPAAAVLLLLALLWPWSAPPPTWSVQALHGEGRVELDGATLAPDEPGLVGRPLGSGGRVRTLDEASLVLDFKKKKRKAKLKRAGRR